MRRFLDQFSLRFKLVAAVLAIVAAALTGISVTSIAAMQGYLLNRVDTELRSVSNQLMEQAESGRNVLSLGEIFPAPGSSVRLPSPYVFETRGPDGAVQSTYPDRNGRWPRTPDDPRKLAAQQHRPYTVPAADGGTRWRVLVQPLPGDQFLVVAASLADVDNAVERLSQLSLLIGLAVLAAVALIAVGVVWLSLRPLSEIERTATAIAAGDLSQRVPDRSPRTEVGRLARVLNMTFNQIETAFLARARSESAARGSEERMRRFVADAGHELRSPLTSIRGFAELHRHGAISDPAETAAVMRRIEDEASRMGLLVEDLLLLARLDQHRPIDWKPVDLLALAVDAVAAARAVAPDRPIDLVVNSGADAGSSDPPVVMGDQARLRQVLDNLVRNALTHTPPGTAVEVRVRAEGRTAVLEVADSGPGLDPDQAERVFERFYRADPARSRQHGSAGLGLAIVAALAAAHGGRAGVVTALGAGAAFWVRLPLAPEAAHASPEETPPPAAPLLAGPPSAAPPPATPPSAAPPPAAPPAAAPPPATPPSAAPPRATPPPAAPAPPGAGPDPKPDLDHVPDAGGGPAVPPARGHPLHLAGTQLPIPTRRDGGQVTRAPDLFRDERTEPGSANRDTEAR